MDGVGRENADSLLLTVTGVEHLEAAGPQQGGAIRGCPCRFCRAGSEAVSRPLSKEVLCSHQEEKERSIRAWGLG